MRSEISDYLRLKNDQQGKETAKGKIESSSESQQGEQG